MLGRRNAISKSVSQKFVMCQNERWREKEKERHCLPSYKRNEWKNAKVNDTIQWQKRKSVSNWKWLLYRMVADSFLMRLCCATRRQERRPKTGDWMTESFFLFFLPLFASLLIGWRSVGEKNDDAHLRRRLHFRHWRRCRRHCVFVCEYVLLTSEWENLVVCLCFDLTVFPFLLVFLLCFCHRTSPRRSVASLRFFFFVVGLRALYSWFAVAVIVCHHHQSVARVIL